MQVVRLPRARIKWIGETRIKGTGHEDFQFFAAVHYAAIGEFVDTHPDDDVCPRPPNPETGNKGCGSKNAGGTLGADVKTDVVAK